MGLQECEARAFDEAEASFSRLQQAAPLRYGEFRLLFDDLLLSVEDLDAERNVENVKAFDHCLKKWLQAADQCINRHTQDNS